MYNRSWLRVAPGLMGGNPFQPKTRVGPSLNLVGSHNFGDASQRETPSSQRVAGLMAFPTTSHNPLGRVGVGAKSSVHPQRIV
jgi:hypothetical protein